MIKVIKKRKNKIIHEPVPKILMQFIRYCDLTLGNSFTRKYTKIIFQMNKPKVTYQGACNQPRYMCNILVKNNKDLLDILDTIAHEMAHIVTFHVLEIDYFDVSTAFKRENWNEPKEEFLVEALAYKLVHTFIKDNMEEYSKNISRLHKYFELETE